MDFMSERALCCWTLLVTLIDICIGPAPPASTRPARGRGGRREGRGREGGGEGEGRGGRGREGRDGARISKRAEGRQKHKGRSREIGKRESLPATTASQARTGLE